MSRQRDSGRFWVHARSKRKRRRAALTVGAIVLAVMALAALLGLGLSSGAGKVPRGVEVEGMAIGGKSTGEAERILRERAYALDEMRLSGDSEEVTIPTNSLEVKPDVQTTVRNAMQGGREGNVIERIGERASGVFGTVEVPLEISYSEAAIRAQSQSLASQIDTEPRQATVDVGASGAEVTPSAEGYKVNVGSTAGNIREAIESLESEAELEGSVIEPEITTTEAEDAAEQARTAVAEPAMLNADGEQWRLNSAQIAAAVDVAPQNGELEVNLSRESLRGSLKEMYSSVNVAATEADYRFAGDSVKVTSSDTGQRIESQKLMDDLHSGLLGDGLFGSQRSYDVSVV